jgi:hypothetical protein
MPVSDFIEQATTIRSGGRLIVCRPPTVATIFRVLETYGMEIRALAAARHKDPEKFSDIVEHAVDLLIGLRSPASVLETCCRVVGGVPGDVAHAIQEDPALAPVLVRAVLGMCDGPRIAEALQLGAEAPPAEVQDAEDSYLDDVVVSMSQRFGITPQELVEWRYEAFLSAAQALGRTVATGTSNSQADAQTFQAMGLDYQAGG